MKPLYYIHAGVRRAVAAREAGRPDIPARIIASGRADVMTRVSLDQLYSPKRTVPRDYRYIRGTEYPTLVLGTEPPPIDLEPLGAPGQGSAVPLSQVVLN